MVHFEDLQSLWQKQPARAASPARAAAQTAALTTAFRRYGRRNDLINYAKVVLVASQLVFLVSRLHHRPLALFGACLAVFGACLFLIHDWRSQRAIARLNFAEPSTDFLRNALARLNAQRDPFRNREFLIAMGGCWTGCTLILVSDWPKLTFGERAAGHAMICAIPFLVYRFGRFVRGKRFRSECLPLIERLTAVLETIEGGRP